MSPSSSPLRPAHCSSLKNIYLRGQFSQPILESRVYSSPKMRMYISASHSWERVRATYPTPGKETIFRSLLKAIQLFFRGGKSSTALTLVGSYITFWSRDTMGERISLRSAAILGNRWIYLLWTTKPFITREARAERTRLIWESYVRSKHKVFYVWCCYKV